MTNVPKGLYEVQEFRDELLRAVGTEIVAEGHVPDDVIDMSRVTGIYMCAGAGCKVTSVYIPGEGVQEFKQGLTGYVNVLEAGQPKVMVGMCEEHEPELRSVSVASDSVLPTWHAPGRRPSFKA